MGALWQDVREIVHEQRQYRDLLFQMAKRDLVLRYKQTFMGAAWAIFMPLVNTIIFTFIFTRIARVSVGMPYPVFAYSGLVAWNLFAAALRFSIISLTSNIPLVTKVYFPREIFPISTVLVSLIDFVIANCVLVLLMLYYGMTPPPTVVLLPVVLLVHVTFTLGVSLYLAMANLFYRDVKYLFEVVITVWMFATSVLYPVHGVEGMLGMVLRANPMTPIIDAYRVILFEHHLPAAGPFAFVTLVAVVIFGAGWLAFHRAEFQFAEYI